MDGSGPAGENRLTPRQPVVDRVGPTPTKAEPVTSNNRRKADRVDVGIPAQLHTRIGPVAAEVVDLSRTGLRLRFPISAMPTDSSPHAGKAADRAAEFLAPTFGLDMHFEKLGPLLNKCVTPIRVGIPSDAEDMIEVCCEFENLFADEESGYLELTSPLPPLRDSVDVWVDVVPDPEPEPTQAETVIASIPRQRYRALVSSLKHDAPPSFFCHTDMVTLVGVRVRLQRDEAGVPAGQDLTLSEALSSLIARYGAELELRLVDKGGDIWRGPSRFSGIELPLDYPTEMLVTLAFDRNLSLAELRALGLLSHAA